MTINNNKSNSSLAFVFPGQGSQKQGTLAAIAEQYDVVKTTFSEASDVLGYDLWALSQEGSAEELSLTERTQPLLLTASTALWRVWQDQGGESPALMAGHSLGEWSALVCAGVVDFTDAVKLVQLRGKYMQEAVPQGVGSMAAVIGLDDEVIVDACKEAEEGEVVSAVNFNAPSQVVIAGHVGAIDRAINICKEKGAKRAMPLAVSAPFHSVLLKPAADRLADELTDIAFKSPQIPVVHNVNAQTTENAETIKALMIEQIYHPVLWVDCVNALANQGVENIIECGPGKVLSGLIKRINRSLNSATIETPDELAAVLSK